MYYFIVNPNARSGKGRIIWQKVCQVMNSKGLAYEALFTEKKGQAAELAEKRRSEATGQLRVKERIRAVTRKSLWLWEATELSRK